MAELTLPVALRLAASLVSIGHPYAQAVIDATALDLIKWCDSTEQAEALIESARTTWEGGWPERGGTKCLRDLHRSMFAAPAAWSPERSEREYAERTARDIQRGLLCAPCELCRAEGHDHCEWGGLRRHAAENAAQEARQANAPPPRRKAAVPITYQQMQNRAQAVYEEEQRRKKEQLDQEGLA